uniref:Vg1 n=1 Tax=Eleutherodactylus cystignathoides TaxID=122124 RepID=Q9DFV1_9NEOB|nr:Vg1 [Eleutherodactylus cystignathoides]
MLARPLNTDSDFRHREDYVLIKLGHPDRPNPVSPPPVPPVLWKIYNQRMGSKAPKKNQDLCYVEEFNVPGSIIRVFPDQGEFAPWSPEHPSNLCLQKIIFFNLSIMEKEEVVTMGRLELRFNQNAYYGLTFELRLYMTRMLSLKEIHNQKSSRKLLAAQTFRLLHKSLYFDLTNVCETWRNHRKNLGLLLEIFSRDEGTLDECWRIQTFLSTSLITVTLNPLQCKKPRTKRSYGTLPLMASNICKKRRLYIDFKAVGWQNWVIAPHGYFANYCHGECPYPLTMMLRGSNHAILQTLAHSFAPEDVPLPCCVPIKMAPISMLFYDNNDNVVLRHYDNMAVDECGCR